MKIENGFCDHCGEYKYFLEPLKYDTVSPVLGHWTVYRFKELVCGKCCSNFIKERRDSVYRVPMNKHEYPWQYLLYAIRGMSIHRQFLKVPAREEMMDWRKARIPFKQMPWPPEEKTK